jgi:hypothetical protein
MKFRLKDEEQIPDNTEMYGIKLNKKTFTEVKDEKLAGKLKSHPQLDCENGEKDDEKTPEAHPYSAAVKKPEPPPPGGQPPHKGKAA